MRGKPSKPKNVTATVEPDLLTTVRFSYYADGYSLVPEKEITLKEYIEIIQTQNVERVAKLRSLSDASYKKNKASMPAVTFSCTQYTRATSKDANGTLYTRKQTEDLEKKGYILHHFTAEEKIKVRTYLVMVDIDPQGSLDMNSLKEDLQEDAHVMFFHDSLSGKGLRAGVLTSEALHLECFEAVRNYFLTQHSVQIDPSCKDIGRLAFLSHDAVIHFIPHPAVLPVTEWLPKKEAIQQIDFTRSDDSHKQKAVERILNILSHAKDKERHRLRLVSGFLAGGYVAGGLLSDSDILPALLDTSWSIANDEAAAKREEKTIMDAFTKGKEKPIYSFFQNGALEKYYTEKSKDYSETPSESIVFWYEQTKQKVTTLNIDSARFIEFLHKGGFTMLRIDSLVQLVRMENNIVDTCDRVHVKKYVFDFIDNLPLGVLEGTTNYRVKDLRKLVIDKNNFLFSDGLFECLPSFEMNPLLDTKGEAFFFYKNGFVKVNASGYALHPYSDLAGHHVWKSQIKAREFTSLELFKGGKESKSPICQFLKLICDDSSSKYLSMVTHLGYVLHRYKIGNAQIVILLDESKEKSSEGGTGKGLVLQMLSHMRNTCLMDGNATDFKNQFLWQQVTHATEIIQIDELPESFDTRVLFSVASSGINVNQKGKAAFYIPHERSPKLMCTTNFETKGVGASYERREYKFPLTRKFGADYTPEDEFKHRFFDDWNETQWNDFDNYMIYCCQIYLQKGIVRADSDVLREKKLNAEISEDFQTLFDTFIVAEDKSDAPQYTRAEVMAHYKLISPYTDAQSKGVSMALMNALRIWCRLKNYIIEEGKTNGTRYFQIIKKVQ